MTDARQATPTPTAIDALAAPSRDGELLIAPDAGRMISDARSNRSLRATYDFTLLDRPVGEWLAERTRDDAPLVVMSGHQPEFFHPGVWIKHVLGARLAERIGGRMQFLVVDSDVPGIIQLNWPRVIDGQSSIESARAAAVMEWRGYEHIHDRKDIDYGAIFDAARSGFSDVNQSNLDVFALPMTRTGKSTYVDRWIAGIKAFDASMDVPETQFTRISERFDFRSPSHDAAAAALVGHLIVNAHDFRAAYNAALRDFRRQRGIRGIRHPIPDLAENERRIECPFWLTHAEFGRERLYATPCKAADCVTIFAGARPLAEIQTADLIASPADALGGALDGWGVRPRALAQTLYARTFACDLFIHGIGGAKYDQITDDLFRRFFDANPPAYGCASATCRLNLPSYDGSDEEWSAAVRQLRDLRYNPQRCATDAQLAVLKPALEERDAAIAESDRLRSTDPRNRRARKAAFDRIHAANRRILNDCPELPATITERVERLGHEMTQNRIASGREWFFALYSREQLGRLRDLAWARVDEATPTL